MSIAMLEDDTPAVSVNTFVYVTVIPLTSPEPVNVMLFFIPRPPPCVVVVPSCDVYDITAEPLTESSPALAATAASEPANADTPILVSFFIIITPLIIN